MHVIEAPGRAGAGVVECDARRMNVDKSPRPVLECRFNERLKLHLVAGKLPPTNEVPSRIAVLTRSIGFPAPDSWGVCAQPELG